MNRRLWIRPASVILVATALVSSSACAAKTINQVLADPSRYRDRQVKLSGAVVDSYSLVNRGAYRLMDRTGQLWVVSDRGVPRIGARVTVKGTVRDTFNLGSLGQRIELPGVGSGLVLLESSHKAR